MFVPSLFTRASFVLAILFMGAIAGCQTQADPDSKAGAGANSQKVIVEITGMT